eukprot:1051153-Prorocentrum_minimum.AAC.1
MSRRRAPPKDAPVRIIGFTGQALVKPLRAPGGLNSPPDCLRTVSTQVDSWNELAPKPSLLEGMFKDGGNAFLQHVPSRYLETEGYPLP